MREKPPESLVRLLAELGLATADELAALTRPARRLARGLPLFQSVWVDAAARAGLLSPLQAVEINAGRGASLRVGPWVMVRRLGGLGYAGCYHARHVESGAAARLLVIDSPGESSADWADQLNRLARRVDELRTATLDPVEETGADGGRYWATCALRPGLTAREWLIHHGRMAGEQVLQIAQAMMPGLVALERAGLCHGDIRASTLLLDAAGAERVALLFPGVRGVVRPTEGFAHADLPPEALEGLAPERITRGQPPSRKADLFACGCLWWHLLAGRPPVLGGDGLAKLRAAAAGMVPDVRRVAPDVPEPLARAIAACTAPDPARRPDSALEAAVVLGPVRPTGGGRRARTRLKRPAGGPARRRPLSIPRLAGPLGIAAAVVVVLVIGAMAISWSLHRGGVPGVAAGSAEESNGSNTPLPAGSPSAGQESRPRDAHATTAHEPAPPRRGDSEPDELVLAADLPTDASAMAPRAGQRIRGAGPQAVVLRVPPAGLRVEASGVQFENIAFVGDPPAEPDSARPAALVRLEAAEATFRRCAFRSSEPGTVAVLWVHPADPAAARRSLPSGRVVLEDCVLEGVAAGVDCRTAGAMALELRNVLGLGPGPLVRLDHAPAADEPVAVRLAQVTLRQCGPLLECSRLDTKPVGSVTVETLRSVLFLRDDAPLVRMVGGRGPQAFLAALRWSGEGAIIPPKAIVAGWKPDDGPMQTVDDTSIAIDGVVRGEVTFAGHPDGGTAASAATGWNAPLRSNVPPGIDPGRLPQTAPRTAAAQPASTGL